MAKSKGGLLLPEHVDSLGERRVLGTLSPPPGFQPRFAAPVPAFVPEDQWVEFDLDEELSRPIETKDQNGRGACNGFATATVMEYARAIAGEEHVPLSGWFPYAIMCKGFDRGSMISEALELAVEKGLAPEEFVEYGIIDPRKLSDESFRQALRFRIEIGARMANFRELMSQTQLRRPFDFSLKVGANFDRLDEDGAIGVTRGAGDHAIAGGIGAKRRKSNPKKWLIKFRNSWTERWGQDGCAWAPEEAITLQTYFEAYCIQAVRSDPDRPLPVSP